MSGDSRSASWRHVRREFLLVLALSLFALFIFSLFSLSPNGSFRSAEFKFSDASAHGLSIVPASCPSSPHYAGECTGQPPPPPSSGCVLFANPTSIAPGESSTLEWASSPGATSGAITPGIGPVPAQGTISVSPSQTTTYVYSGTSQGVQGRLGSLYSCLASVTVVPPGQCAANYFCQGSDLYYQTSQCSNEFIQHCARGCSGSACIGAPAPSALLAVSPLLVRNGTTVQVSWQALHVQSCTVSGTNGDSWSSTSGSYTSRPILGQTVYVLTCQALPGASPSTITDSKTVNIIPIFQEI